MRRLRGWITNLADGLGPPPGSVNVSAEVTDGAAEINNTTHQTGTLTRIHETGGSGSPTKADSFGHFGWDMQLSPGRINVTVNPTDPQSEFRKRYPDESAQVGLAYHSDIERLAWAGGRDGLAWNAIDGGDDPTAAQWSWIPTDSRAWGRGNWGIHEFLPNMKLTLHRGIGFVGGALFSIEDSDLTIPVDGATAPPANAAGSDRWDLLCLRIETDPAAADYGKQSFEFIQGIPGAGLMEHPGQPTGARRLALYLLKVAAGASVYSTAVDLRRWLWHPRFPSLSYSTTGNGSGVQSIPPGASASVLNTVLAAAFETVLPLGYNWNVQATYEGMYGSSGLLSGQSGLTTVLMGQQGRSLDTTAVLATETGISDGIIFNPDIAAVSRDRLSAVTFNLGQVGSYHRDGAQISTSRTWWRHRIVIRHWNAGSASGITCQYPRASVQFVPVL